MHLGFQFHFAPKRSTPYRLISEVADRMISEVLVANQFDSFMPNRGAIDGWIGVIYREESSITPEEHGEFIEWIEALPVDAVAHVGDLEDADTLDTTRTITERIVRIEGCSSADRDEANAERDSLELGVQGAETNGDEQ